MNASPENNSRLPLGKMTASTLLTIQRQSRTPTLGRGTSKHRARYGEPQLAMRCRPLSSVGAGPPCRAEISGGIDRLGHHRDKLPEFGGRCFVEP